MIWVGKNYYLKMGSALKKRHGALLKSLLRPLEKQRSVGYLKPSRREVCPDCGRFLVKKAIPYIEAIVEGCPADHGVWLTEEVFKDLERVSRQWPSRKLWFDNPPLLQRHKLFFLVTGILAVVLFFEISYPFFRTPSGLFFSFQDSSTASGGRYAKVIPYLRSLPVSFQEYFQIFFPLCEEAIAYKNKMTQAIESRLSTYGLQKAFQSYEEGTLTLITALGEIKAPPLLEQFHEYFLKGLQAQRDFYYNLVQIQLLKMEKRPVPQEVFEAAYENAEKANHEFVMMWILFKTLFPNIEAEGYRLVRELLSSFFVPPPRESPF